VRELTRESQVATLVSLLQAGPELVELFDDVIVMAEGNFLYHGPVDGAAPYLATLGYQCPKGRQLGDFLVDLCTPLRKRYYNGSLPQRLAIPSSTIDELAAAWRSYFKSKQEQEPAKREQDDDDKARAELFECFQKSNGYFLSPMDDFRVAIERQLRLLWTDRIIYCALIAQMTVIGVFTGLLFFDAPLAPETLEDTDWVKHRVAALFFGQIFYSLSAFCTLPFTIEQRNVFYKHRDSGMIRTTSFVASTVLSSALYGVAESLLVSSILFFMVNVIPISAPEFGSAFTLFVICNVLTNWVVGNVIRLVAYW